jgi:hypothetical protein
MWKKGERKGAGSGTLVREEVFFPCGFWLEEFICGLVVAMRIRVLLSVRPRERRTGGSR